MPRLRHRRPAALAAASAATAALAAASAATATLAAASAATATPAVTAVPAAGDTTPTTTAPPTTTPAPTPTTPPTTPTTPPPKRQRRPAVPLTGVHFSATRVSRGTVLYLAFDLGHRATVAVRLRGRLAARLPLTRGHHRLPFGTSHLQPGTTYTATVTATAPTFRPAVVRVPFTITG